MLREHARLIEIWNLTWWFFGYCRWRNVSRVLIFGSGLALKCWMTLVCNCHCFIIPSLPLGDKDEKEILFLLTYLIYSSRVTLCWTISIEGATRRAMCLFLWLKHVLWTWICFWAGYTTQIYITNGCSEMRLFKY